MQKRQIIKMIQQLSARILPKDASVFLFGSQARGDNSDGSDWDLLILLNHGGSVSLSDRGDYVMPIYQLGAELGVDINPVIYTNADWQQRSFTPFYKNVSQDRIKIWG